jgi:NTE family protein
MTDEDLGTQAIGSSPVRRIPTDPPVDVLSDGIALCLSGGGYRATLFHTGALWRLNELGYLPRLERISSVSGGSITAATLGQAWDRLDFNEDGVATAFDREVVTPLRALCSRTIDVPAIVFGLLAGWLGAGWPADRIARSYRRHLLGDTTLADLPDRPRIIINATNLGSGVLWRFSKPYMRDWRVGEVAQPRTRLSTAVAASSAFPPLLSPLRMRFRPADFVPQTGQDLQFAPYNTHVSLTDGGVYDNLGLETAWKKYRTILISDAGGKPADDPTPAGEWAGQSIRVVSLMSQAATWVRKRQSIAAFTAGERAGAYWGIRSEIANYHAAGSLPCPPERAMEVALTPTRLKALDTTAQERLIDWGYAICDAAMRAHVDQTLPAPADFPYAHTGV